MDPSKKWPYSGLKGKQPISFFELIHLTNYILGHTAAWLHLIFCICGALPVVDIFLAYLQHYDLIPQPSASRTIKMDPMTSLYALKCTLQADKSPLGDVILITSLQAAVQFDSTFWYCGQFSPYYANKPRVQH